MLEPTASKLSESEIWDANELSESVTPLAAATSQTLTGQGKQLRPQMVMASELLGPQPGSDAVRRAALAVEYFHGASVVHDDVTDDAATRRGNPTIGTAFGHSTAALTGGWMFGRASSLVSACGDRAASRFAESACRVCDGQILEILQAYDIHRNVDEYTAAIGGKTAALFEFSSAIGAELGEADAETVAAAEAYGWNFGLAYQILDDLQDLVASEAKTGKPRGQDIANGVYTLPVIYAIEEAPELRSMISDAKNKSEVSAAVESIYATSGPQRAIEVALDYEAKARSAVHSMPGAETLLWLLRESISDPLKDVA